MWLWVHGLWAVHPSHCVVQYLLLFFNCWSVFHAPCIWYVSQWTFASSPVLCDQMLCCWVVVNMLGRERRCVSSWHERAINHSKALWFLGARELIIGSFELEGTLKGHLVQSPCNEWTSTALLGAQSPVQPDLECLQGWDVPHLSGQSVPVPQLPYCKKNFLLALLKILKGWYQVSLEPSLLQAQPQLSACSCRAVFHPSDHFLWPFSGRAPTGLSCTGGSASGHSTPHEASPAQSRGGRITSLALLATLLWMQPRIQLALWAVKAQCWLIFFTPKSFSAAWYHLQTAEGAHHPTVSGTDGDVEEHRLQYWPQGAALVALASSICITLLLKTVELLSL